MIKYKLSKGRIAFHIFNYSFLILLSLAFLIPYWMIVAASISDESYLLTNGFKLFPAQLSLNAYKYIFTQNSLILTAVKNSFIMTIAGTILTTAVSMMYAYPISKDYFKGSRFFSLFIIFTMLFGGGLIPYYLTVTYFFSDTMLAIIIPGAMAPYYAILARNSFMTIPDSLEEAAKIDGASNFRVFLTIFVPLSLPMLATIVLFASVSIWNNWVGPMLFIDSREKQPIQYIIQQILTSVSDAYGGSSTSLVPTNSIKFASVVVGSLPIIAAYPFLQKYFITGMVMGGVKE